jgi:hypothetical protein
VDPAFGTGALKITPAHDPNDYALAQRHALPLISVMNRDASINHHGGARYAGLSREDCRARLWKDLVEAGLVLNEHTSARGGPGTKDHTQRVPRSQRGGEIIEPMVSPQWFVRTEGMAARAVQAVRGGDVAIVPERFEKVWYNWLENIHDWCISRQLWWGHRIPVYYVTPPAGSAAGKTHYLCDKRRVPLGILQRFVITMVPWLNSHNITCLCRGERATVHRGTHPAGGAGPRSGALRCRRGGGAGRGRAGHLVQVGRLPSRAWLLHVNARLCAYCVVCTVFCCYTAQSCRPVCIFDMHMSGYSAHIMRQNFEIPHTLRRSPR